MASSNNEFRDKLIKIALPRLIELAKKDLTDIKQEYTNAMESRACADI